MNRSKFGHVCIWLSACCIASVFVFGCDGQSSAVVESLQMEGNEIANRVREFHSSTGRFPSDLTEISRSIDLSTSRSEKIDAVWEILPMKDETHFRLRLSTESWDTPDLIYNSKTEAWWVDTK